MADHDTSFSPARFLLLILASAASAVFVCTLPEHLLPDVRYLVIPTDTASVPLAGWLSSPWDTMLADMLGQVRWIALELLVWLLGSLCIYSMPVYLAASAYRGACLGYVLSLLTGNPPQLSGHTSAMLSGYLLVTVVLFVFACGTPPFFRWHRRADSTAAAPIRYGIRFFVCAGLIFCITLICGRL